MRKGMLISLILVSLMATAAVAEDQVMYQARPDDPWVVFQGSGSYLGVDVRDVTSERVAALKLKEEAGVEVVMVDQDAPAGKAGLRENDVIQSFNGQKVDSAEQLRRMIRETPPGRTVNLGVVRDGQPMNLSAALGDRRTAGKVIAKRQMVIPPIPPVDVDIPTINMMVGTTSRSGCMVENLTPQLADFFGVKNNGGGVLVRSVEKGSAAESAGLKAGDVVVRIDKEKINDMSDWRRVLRSRSGQIPVTVVRDRREQTIQMKLPEHKKQGSSFGEGANTWISDLDDFDMDELQLQLERIRPQLEEGTKRIAMVFSDKNKAEMKKAVEDAQAATKKFREVDMEKIRKEIERATEQMRLSFDRDEM